MDRYVIEENENATVMQNRLQNVPASRRFLVVSHPEDRETALEIGREILDVRNCVILAARDAGLREDGGKALLEGLHMAVFVVTERFLRAAGDAPCRAALREALAKPGLRVLLIQAEKGIEREFDRIVGPRQLLDRTAGDYADKLKLYIEGYADPYLPIVTDEERKTREGLLRFRIFISYRKKDAAFLERILAAIRACPALSDAAVWYDDSLVPGEDYNEQIDRALLDADLVLFAVTDRFTEEGNYVLVNEYPRAVSERKPLLAVLAEGTDREAIRRSYPRLEKPFPFEDAEAWLEAVRSAGAALGRLGDGLSADELYLLACEYESGVNTASSLSAAIGLLRQAAQGGSPQAMAKLGEHYAAGAGVERDAEKAVALYRDALAAYEKRLAEGPEPKLTKRGYAIAVYRIADELFKEYVTAGKLEDAREMVRLQYLGQEEAKAYDAFLVPVSAYVHEAMLHTAEGAWEEALACYDRAEKEIPLAEALDRPDGGGGEGTIYAKGTVMRLDVFVNRGHIRSGLALKGEEGRFPAAVRDLRAAMEQLLQFGTLSDMDRLLPGGRELLLTTVKDLLSLALAAEEKPEGMPEAQRIYGELCTQLGALLGAGGPPELLNLYGQALTNAAMAGRAVPDRDRLLEAYKVYAVLHENFPEEALYRQNLEMTSNFLALWPASADVLKRQGIRPARGIWLPVKLTPEDAARFFGYPDEIPEGAYGDVCGSFRVSAYRCPHCAQRLYKTVFPEGRDPRLPIAPDGRRYLEPARVFASPCGRFFAAPKGMRLTDGVFLQAILALDPGDKAQSEEFLRWWHDFDARGDLLAVRRE